MRIAILLSTIFLACDPASLLDCFDSVTAIDDIAKGTTVVCHPAARLSVEVAGSVAVARCDCPRADQ